MAEAVPDPLVSAFLLESKALIVDSASSARTRLVGALVQLGAKRHNILATGSLQEAAASIPTLKPKLVLCDFMIGNRSGLELLQEQRAAHADLKKCVFILVTGNTSQSAVARAAEEDVDTYILKPYTQESFKRSLLTAIAAKINPSEYLKTIEEGKDHLSKSEPEAAIQLFEKAMGMSTQPTLACFYLGQADLMKEAMDHANQKFGKGLTYSKIHYKCLLGLFEVLTQQKRYVESYEVVKKIAQYFPANPKRLASVLRLAVMTKSFEDIEGFYRVFVQLDERTDELINYMCSALAVTAKHYILTKNKRRALELFDSAIITSAGRTRFIRYAIECLTEFNLSSDADVLLKRFPPDMRDSEDFLVSDLLVSSRVSQSGKVLQRGRELLKRGISAPGVFKVMIEHSAKTGHQDQAADFVAAATKKWPNLADELKLFLAKHLVDTGKHPENISKSM